MSLFLAGLCCALTSADLRAQTNVTPARVTNRYLLLVESSSAMQDRLDGTFRLIAELYTSGMGGRLQRGDTIGVWTFNNEIGRASCRERV